MSTYNLAGEDQEHRRSTNPELKKQRYSKTSYTNSLWRGSDDKPVPGPSPVGYKEKSE